MKRRDALIVAAVLVVVGVAAADVLRPGAGVEEAEKQTHAEAPEPKAREHAAELDRSRYRSGVLAGTLVFTEPAGAEECRIRAVALASGDEEPLPRLVGDCSLWAPPRGRNVAYGLGGGYPSKGRVPFAVLNLDEPSRDVREFTRSRGR